MTTETPLTTTNHFVNHTLRVRHNIIGRFNSPSSNACASSALHARPHSLHLRQPWQTS